MTAGGASNPRAGAYFERRVSASLTSDGYLVMRSAGSRGAVDLIALKAGEVLLVQCKINGRLDTEAWNALRRIAMQAGAIALMASRGRASRIVWTELAEAARPHTRRRLTPWEPDRVSSPRTDESGPRSAEQGVSGT
jgi:Holliday junction resolvase